LDYYVHHLSISCDLFASPTPLLLRDREKKRKGMSEEGKGL
jgi:hypothetical protein